MSADELHVEQPMPTRNDRPSIQSLVRADLDHREQVGIQRYGTSLQPHNGRDALRDAYEEVLDLACYVKQAMVERDLAAERDVAACVDLAGILASLPRVVRQRRERHGLSLRVAAHQAGISFSSLTRFENGGNVNQSTVAALLAWTGQS